MDVVLDRFQTLEGLLIKYNYQGGDSVTIITNDKLRLVEASGDPNCFEDCTLQKLVQIKNQFMRECAVKRKCTKTIGIKYIFFT